MELVFERTIDLSTAIVWDALVDDELVSGWLAEASIEPVEGGRYDLVWQYSTDQPPTKGVIATLVDRRTLVIDTDNRGRLAFDLEETDGVRRSAATLLRLVVSLELDAAFLARVKANWMISLDQLEDLLRGHPVDWKNWDNDRIDVWTEYRDSYRARR